MVVVLVLVAATSSPSAVVANVRLAFPVHLVASLGSNRFLGGRGDAVSTLALAADREGSIAVQIKDRPPGEQWQVQLYDQGTCAHPVDVLARLPDLVVGSSGVRTVKLTLGPALWARIVSADETPRPLVVRIAHPGYAACARYFPAH